MGFEPGEFEINDAFAAVEPCAFFTVEDVGRGRIFYPKMWPRYAKIGDQLKRRSSSDATKVGVELKLNMVHGFSPSKCAEVS